MIVPMKKIFLIVQGKDAAGAVDALRDLGVVHVICDRAPKSSGVSTLDRQIKLLQQVRDVLIEKQPVQERLAKKDWLFHAEEILQLVSQIQQLKEDIVKRQALINEWDAWGDFNLEDIKSLGKKGICFQFAKIPIKSLKDIPDEATVAILQKKGGLAFCVVVSNGRMDFPFEKLTLPPVRLSQLKNMQEQAKIEIVESQRRLKDFCKYRKSFQEIFENRLLELKYQQALAGMESDRQLVFLKGFCPITKIDSLKEKARGEKWALHLEDPSDDDKVPTLLKNPRWVEIVKPVFGVMNILPGYKEVDISLFFLLFFSVFFGMLIGDAGYGLLFFVFTFLGHVRFERKLKDQSVFVLMYVLSICAIIWGLLTGTIFGQVWLPTTVKPLLPWLRVNENIQMLCFLIGAIHLSIAHLWRGVLKFPSIAALSEIGWLSLLWGMFYLAKYLIIGESFPSFGKVFFIVGPIFIILFSKPKKNIFKTVGLGFGDLLLNLFNTFTDIVSYIRLFAVGLATVAVADAFNQMALDLGMGSFLTGAATACILVFGHLLNLILGAMAILVHGVRLNVLEFSSHLNMEWSGVAFNPLRRTREINI